MTGTAEIFSELNKAAIAPSIAPFVSARLLHLCMHSPFFFNFVLVLAHRYTIIRLSLALLMAVLLGVIT